VSERDPIHACASGRLVRIAGNIFIVMPWQQNTVDQSVNKNTIKLYNIAH